MGKPLELNDLIVVKDFSQEPSYFSFSTELLNSVSEIMKQGNLQMPKSISEAYPRRHRTYIERT